MMHMVAKASTQIGERNERRRAGGGTRLYSRATSADRPLNDAARYALRNLSERWSSHIPSVILYAINMLVCGNTGILKTKSRIKTQSKASTLITILVTILADQLPKRYQDGLIKLVI